MHKDSTLVSRVISSVGVITAIKGDAWTCSHARKAGALEHFHAPCFPKEPVSLYFMAVPAVLGDLATWSP